MSEIYNSPKWWGKGLLFENCNCQMICPAHLSFKQSCTLERCLGYWGIRFDEGAYDDVRLDGLMVLILWDSPQRMYDGNWTEGIYLDEKADAAQRQALETIFRGSAGGPWAILSKFVGTWLDTQVVAFRFTDEGRKKQLSVDGLFETKIETLRGPTPEADPTLTNLYNTIHGPVHVLAKGSSRCSAAPFALATDSTHSLYSTFSWEGP
ncbi:MAG: DUF1326 domain-containing protein [Deltaproteobacteria bacterium]|nr:DUF1326 domain-containing protein [Deltaproteobacteria bacterium]